MLDKLAELMRKMPNQQPHLQGDLAAFVDHCGSGRTKTVRNTKVGHTAPLKLVQGLAILKGGENVY